MVTKNPRINIVIESELHSFLSKLAKSSGVSLSLLSRDLIKEALEIREDLFWQKVAEKRDSTFSLKDAVSHEKMWG